MWLTNDIEAAWREVFLLGFLLSVIGLIIEGLLPAIAKPNPVRRVSQADSRILVLGDPEPTKEPQRLSADGRPLRKCPFCAEMILAEAVICRFCQRDVPLEQIAQVPNLDVLPIVPNVDAAGTPRRR